ncbi:MAG: hypothetical protein ACMXYB_00230 [Candidatus Woesearchaeota archaeon]
MIKLIKNIQIHKTSSHIDKIHQQNKKSQTMSLVVLASFLISILILVLMINVIGSTGEQLVTASQDAACRIYLEASASVIARSGTTIEQLAVAEQTFFGRLPQYCRTEFLIFEHTDEEYVFSRLSDAALRCNRRYGSGELRFLDYSQREGSYCFVCAEIEFENVDSSNRESFRYKNLGSFMEDEIPRERNDERENARELSNLFYVDVRGGENQRLELENRIYSSSLDTQIKNEITPIFDYFNSLYTREFRVTEKNYVVYRYQAIQPSALNVAAGVGAAAVVSRTVRRGIYAAGRGVFSLAKGAGACVLGTASVVGTIAGCSILFYSIYGVSNMVFDHMDQREIQSILEEMRAVFYYPGLEIEPTSRQQAQFQEMENIIDNPSIESAMSFINSYSNINDVELTKQSEETLEALQNVHTFNRFESRQEEEMDQLRKQTSQEKIQQLFTELLTFEVSNSPIVSNFNFEQYVEIMPQGDFYRECGIVSNTQDRR